MEVLLVFLTMLLWRKSFWISYSSCSGERCCVRAEKPEGWINTRKLSRQTAGSPGKSRGKLRKLPDKQLGWERQGRIVSGPLVPYGVDGLGLNQAGEKL